MQNIKPGDEVRAFTATNQWIPLRATTTVTDGVDFPVVWLCSNEDWADFASGENGDDDVRAGIPWPAEAVEVVAGGERS